MILGQFNHELISPFSHGIELRPGKGYSYIGALYNIVVCASVGVFVSLITAPPKKENLEGLTVFDVKKLKEIFKGSPVNEKKGEKVKVNFIIDENNLDSIRFSEKDMKIMKAKPGDLVYLCDNRSWLGGLKSIHSVYGEPHRQEGIVFISSKHQERGLFEIDRELNAEKEM